MLGMDRNTLLKIQIIETLDALQTPISMKELQDKIGYASLGTIRVNCKELQSIIEDLYTDKDYSLKLRMDNGRGIQLDRTSTNLQSLISYLYQHDLACEIIRAVLAKRKISAIQFCMDKNISESKLRRKIKEINQELTDYDLYISCSAKISLKGREVDIRRFYYIFVRGLYYQFSQIDWLNTSSYLQLARKIEEYLKLTINPTNSEMICFWLLITNQSLSKKGILAFNEVEDDCINQFKYPKRPSFLRTWNTNEWKFFLYAIYSSQLNDFELQQKNASDDPFFNQVVTHWTTCFSHHFRSLSNREQKVIARKLKQHYASLVFFHLNDQMLEHLKNTVALDNLQEQCPYYYRRFDAFWDDFTQAVPGFDRRQLRIFSFLTCVEFFSLENCLPEISVYAFSEHNQLFSVFIQEKINLHFKNRYHLRFVEDPNDAQLIIGTSPGCKELQMEDKKYVIIRANLCGTDFNAIENVLEVLVKKELENLSD
ncbi:MAG: helix-turn-helix domain-containing protein [Enterococcus sp.]